MTPLAPELMPLSAVVAATLGEDGQLIEANAGFLRIAGSRMPVVAGHDVGKVLIQPDLAALLRAPARDGQLVHDGLLTLGDYTGKTRTLRGRVWRDAGQLQLVAEYDVMEMEQLQDTVLEVNRGYADAQLKLAQANLNLQQVCTELAHSNLALAQTSSTDKLTGIPNRLKLDEVMAHELARVRRYGEALSVVLLDIDHFKDVNDVHGHAVGDLTLVRIAEIMRGNLRHADTLGRWGGEEFLLVLPNTTAESGLLVAEKIRAAIAATPFEAVGHITASLGVTAFDGQETSAGLFARVDKALYQAKTDGRNRVVLGLP